MTMQIQTQKKMLRDLSTKMIKYTKDPSDPDAIKPYYLFRMNISSNEIKAHLIGYRLKIEKNPYDHEFRYYNPQPEKVTNLITRSKKQIHEETFEENSPIKVTVPLLGSKLLTETNWKIEPEMEKSVPSYTISISSVEGVVYSDTVWLQNYDPKEALMILMKNKDAAIEKQEKALEKLKRKRDALENLYNQIKIL